MIRRAGEILDRFSRRILWASTAFVVVVAGLYALHLGSRLRFSDEADYLAIARNLAGGRGYSIDGRLPTAYRAPGFPLVLGLFSSFGVSVRLLHLVNVTLMAATVWLAWTLANRLGGRIAAAIAALGTALYPLGFFTTSTFYPETFATALLAGAVLCAVLADEATERTRSNVLLGACGLLFSLLYLTVPTYGVAAAITLVWYVWRHRVVALSAIACFLVVFVVPIGMWTARNALELDALVPGTTSAGINLLLGNSEHSTADSGVYVDVSKYNRVAKERHLDEVARDEYFRSAALNYMRAHPSRTLILFFKKTANYFRASNRLATVEESTPARGLLAAVAYYPLVLLLAMRLVMWRKLPFLPAERLIVAIYLLMAPATGVFLTRARYRVPCDELLVVLIALFLGRLWRRRGEPFGDCTHPPEDSTTEVSTVGTDMAAERSGTPGNAR